MTQVLEELGQLFIEPGILVSEKNTAKGRQNEQTSKRNSMLA